MLIFIIVVPGKDEHVFDAKENDLSTVQRVSSKTISTQPKANITVDCQLTGRFYGEVSGQSIRHPNTTTTEIRHEHDG